MLAIAILGDSKRRKVVHSTTSREAGTVKMSTTNNIIIMTLCLCVFRDAKMVYPLQYREMYLHV